MAYTRFRGKHYRKGWCGNLPPSETYIYGSLEYLHCCACRLFPIVNKIDNTSWYGDFMTQSRTSMLKHIRQHRKAGHAVPRAAWRRLVREIRTVGDEY